VRQVFAHDVAPAVDEAVGAGVTMSTTPRTDRHPSVGDLARDPPASRLRTPLTPRDNFSLDSSINPALTAPAAHTAPAAPVLDAVDDRTANGTIRDGVPPLQHAAAAAADGTASSAADSDSTADSDTTEPAAADADSAADTDASAVNAAVHVATATANPVTTNGCRSDRNCGAPAAGADSAASPSSACLCPAERLVMDRPAEEDEAPLRDQGSEADGSAARGSLSPPPAPAVAPQPPLEGGEEEEIVPVEQEESDASPEEVSSEAALVEAADAAEAQRLTDEQRKAFMSINSDPTLSVMEKTSRMQAIHLKRTLETQTRAIAEAAKRNRSNTITYHNRDKNIWGCEHYPRRCSVKLGCCDEWFTCRLCHDAESDHVCDRKSIQEVKCMSCNTVQPVAAECRNCKISFARYFCEICRLYDDSPGKPLYHCDKCGICRVGLNNYHCDKCNACVAEGSNKGQHRCVNNALDVCCPCCQRYLYDSTDKVVFILCGHAMHASCLKDYAAHSYTCPLCHKELGDMTKLYKSYDEEIHAQRMPSEYANHRVVVKCYQCSHESDVSFHFTHHHRCLQCTSYNTYITKQYVATPVVEAAGAATSTSAVAAVPAIGGVIAGAAMAGAGGADVEEP